MIDCSSACTGEEALGLASKLVTDQQMSASTFSRNHEPERGRLNLTAAQPKKGAWSSSIKNQQQYLQVDFLRNVKITKFQTQGRKDYSQWVTSYKFSYAVEGAGDYQNYTENGATKVQSNTVKV